MKHTFELLHFYIENSGPVSYQVEQISLFSKLFPMVKITYVESITDVALTEQYNVEVAPVTIFLCDSKEVSRLYGSQSSKDLQDEFIAIEKVLDKMSQ